MACLRDLCFNTTDLFWSNLIHLVRCLQYNPQSKLNWPAEIFTRQDPSRKISENLHLVKITHYTVTDLMFVVTDLVWCILWIWWFNCMQFCVLWQKSWQPNCFLQAKLCTIIMQVKFVNAVPITCVIIQRLYD